MLETKPGSSIPVKTCFFCKIKIYRFFLYRFFLIALLSNSLKAPCKVFVVIFIDKKFFFKIFVSFHLFLIFVIHLCIASGCEAQLRLFVKYQCS